MLNTGIIKARVIQGMFLTFGFLSVFVFHSLDLHTLKFTLRFTVSWVFTNTSSHVTSAPSKIQTSSLSPSKFFSIPPPISNPWLSVPIILPLLECHMRESYNMCSLFSLPSFSQHCVFVIHPSCCLCLVLLLTGSYSMVWMSHNLFIQYK